MPYDARADLPDGVKALPAHGQDIYMKAFNSAFVQYDGDEAKSHATAWAAVKNVYKQVGGKWLPKETKTEEAKMLSDKNRSKLLQAALVTEYKIGQSTPIPKNLTIEEVFDDKVVYDIDGQLYEGSYELDENDKATFGEPKKVLGTKVYKAMESLQAVYSDIIQEAGRRNASLDSKRLKLILSLCQELLSSEQEPEEKKAQEAITEANAVLVWLKEQAAMKTEDGENYPAAAFAYTPDPNDASTWKVRLWESLEKKVTWPQLKEAVASLSPGGNKGVMPQIPEGDYPLVRSRVRSEFTQLEVSEEDMPRWVKETLVREEVQNFISLTEATFDKGRATVIVIKPGFNADKSRYYPVEMLKRDYKIFEGMKMFADHPTKSEESELPERSIKSWGFVAKLVDVTCDEKGVVTGVADIIEDWLMKKLANMRDKEMLSEMGVSINAIAKAFNAKIDGVDTKVIDRLIACRSVDFVTEPGASGIVTFYESDRNRDIDLVELPGLTERRPDLIKAIEARVRAEISKEVKKFMEDKDRITELEGQNETLTTENTELKGRITEAEKDKAKAAAQATIKEAIAQATLPDAAKERLTKTFENAESADSIAEAIQSEVDYIARLSESSKVKGLGPTQPVREVEEKALRESIKRANPDFTDAQLEVAVTGR